MIHEIKKLTGRALNDLLTAELAAMRKFAYTLTGSMEGANEVVQITVERCLKSGLPHSGARIALFRICGSLWIDEISRRNRRSENEPHEDEVSTTTAEFTDLEDAEQDPASRQELSEMASAFEQLSDEQRIALSMATIEGMSYADIAAALDIPDGTVMSRISRARLALHRRVRSNHDDQ